jgi:serine/threonine protein kinase
MAEIWLAERPGVEGFNKPVAVKKILDKRAKKASYIEMFIDEAKLVSRLQHRNIVQIYELGQLEGTYYIAMEYVDGWDLLKLLKRCSHGRRPLSAPMAVHLAIQVLRGLDYAHNATSSDGQPLSIVHFDVSPSNILLSKTGAIKLTDFGVARAAMELGEGSASDRFRGKIAYMSPEQLENRAVDRRSDIFSSGIVLYEILTLKRLFRSKSNQQTMNNVRKADVEPRLHRHPEIAPQLKAVLRKALAKDRDDRYETAAEMADDLDNYLFDSQVRVTDREVAEFLRGAFARSSAASARKTTTRTGLSWQGGSAVSESKTLDESLPQYVDNGLFDADNALRVFMQLVAQRVTGRLLVSRDGVKKQFFLVRGRLVYSTSTLPTEFLGQLMVKDGAVTERQLGLAKERVEVQGEKLGEALVALGAISFPDLRKWLDKQVEVRVHEVCHWKEGHYSFRPDYLPEPEIPRLDVNLVPLLLRAVDISTRARWLAAYFVRLGNPTLRSADPYPFPIEMLRLAGRDLRLIRKLLAKEATVKEMLRRHGSTEEERKHILRLLFILHQTGHLLDGK